MNDTTWILLDKKFSQFPILRGEEVPDNEIDVAGELLGVVIPSDYRDFVRRYGSAIVGPLPIFGLRPLEAMGDRWSVVDVNTRYRSQEWRGVEEWLIISADHSGNPIGINRDGSVQVSDHDYGSIETLAGGFEEFLLKHCLDVV